MGRRGPAPKPTALRLVGKDPGKRPRRENEPRPDAMQEGHVPEWLPEAAKEVWRQYVPMLAKCGLARSVDVIALARYCEMLARYIRLTQWLWANEHLYALRAEPKKGRKTGRIISLREHPNVEAQRKLNKMMIVLEREFGMTPAARTRITIDGAKGAQGDVDKLKLRFFAGESLVSGESAPA